jgi:DNA mismatch endonuclease, patch repair protein
MMDTISKERRSWNMSRIRSKNTKPELIVRSLLHRMGFRFRVHVKDLPGNPDLVLPKYKTVVFVHGCFWHRHEDCKNSTIPKSRAEWWLEKLDGNVMRDKKALGNLKALGWKTIVIWECELEKETMDDTLKNLKSKITCQN